MDNIVKKIIENDVDNKVIYVNSNEYAKYAFKDKEYTEKFSKDELIVAYKKGALVVIDINGMKYYSKPLWIQLMPEEMIQEYGDCCFVGIYVGKEIIIGSKEVIEQEE